MTTQFTKQAADQAAISASNLYRNLSLRNQKKLRADIETVQNYLAASQEFARDQRHVIPDTDR